jgi:hypothetical protein
MLQVKKKGPNQGRLFYVCARDDGPPPHGRCEFFQWVRQGQRTRSGVNDMSPDSRIQWGQRNMKDFL